jgi:UDP-N-acetylglucosamine:LPS N-acetylglucosamine transferase
MLRTICLMSEPKRILILTSQTGGGHLSLAESLRDLLANDVPVTRDGYEQGSQNTKTATFTIVDPQPRFFHMHYRFVSRKALWLWAAEFRFLDTPGRAMLVHKIFTRLVRRELTDLLDRVRPDLIITTYPFLTYEVRRVLEQRSPAVPLAMLFSDANNIHAALLTERRADATFAPTRETYEQALTAGFDPRRLHLVGWPVRAQFLKAPLLEKDTQQEQRTGMGLTPDRFTVFLQGGGEGAARIESAIDAIRSNDDLSKRVQIILAAGTNASLLARYKTTPNLVVLPYTKEIAPFMAAADAIMGKAGPNVLFEAVMLNKPFIATSFIPGQERDNLSFIQRHGLGWIALRSEEQRALLSGLIHHPHELQAMSSSIEAYRLWNADANGRVCQVVCALLEL